MLLPKLDTPRATAVVRRAQVIQHARLAVGVGAVAGGLVLLSSNVLFLALTGGAALPWTPLLANAALIFGGAMFLRGRRRPGDFSKS